jgi:chromosome segregation ATPase
MSDTYLQVLLEALEGSAAQAWPVLIATATSVVGQPLRDQLAAVQQQMDHQSQQLEQRDVALEEVRLERTNLDNERMAVLGAMDMVREQLKETLDLVETRDGTIVQLTATVQSMTEQVASLRQQSVGHESALQALAQRNQALTGEQGTVLQERDDQIVALTSRGVALAAEVAALQQKLEQQSALLHATEDKDEKLQATLAEVQEEESSLMTVLETRGTSALHFCIKSDACMLHAFAFMFLFTVCFVLWLVAL